MNQRDEQATSRRADEPLSQISIDHMNVTESWTWMKPRYSFKLEWNRVQVYRNSVRAQQSNEVVPKLLSISVADR